ncbi:hypothetical protein [Brevundimonas sp.]
MKKWMAAAGVVVAGLGLGGCDALSNNAVTCLSPAGQGVVLDLAKDEIEKLTSRAVEGDDGQPLVSIGSLRASIASMAFSIEDVRTSKEDPDSTKKFCAGTLKATVPVAVIADAEETFELLDGSSVNDLVDRYGAERSANVIEIPLDFTIQPTDDGKDVYAEIEAPNALTSLFSGLVSAHALKTRIQQAQADQAQAEAEQIRLETEAQNAEKTARLTDARSRYQLAVQGINAVWQAIPVDTRDAMTPQQTAFNRRKNAACAMQASRYSTDETDKEVARMDCETQLMNSRANELSRYVQYDDY